jgi:hypothetical protein
MSSLNPEPSPSLRVVVFGGPSLPPEGVPLSVDVRPPATRRTLKHLADELAGPTVVVLLDGAFFQTPSPTHYDLLYLLSSGVPLIGASSMGALRASELRSRGMRGIGVVYEAVVRGSITDDSELAVAMCPITYSALTVPLIRVRCCLHAARTRGLTEDEAAVAFDQARRIHFLERTSARLARTWRAALPGLADGLMMLLDAPASDIKVADARKAILYALASAKTEKGFGMSSLDPESSHPLWLGR